MLGRDEQIRASTDLESLKNSRNLKETSEREGICDRIPKVMEKKGNFVA